MPSFTEHLPRAFRPDHARPGFAPDIVWHNFAVRIAAGALSSCWVPTTTPGTRGCRIAAFASRAGQMKTIYLAQKFVMRKLVGTGQHNFESRLYTNALCTMTLNYVTYADNECSVERAQTRIESSNGLLPMTRRICVSRFSGLLTGVCNFRWSFRYGIGNQNKDLKIVMNASTTQDIIKYQSETGSSEAGIIEF